VKRSVLFAVCSAAVLAVAGAAIADPTIGSGAQSESSVAPRVLSGEDVRHYRALFADERAGDFAAARQDAEEISDPCLVGYAEAEHFFHAKRTALKTLAAWLEKYDELPVASRVRELAEKRNKRHRVELAVAPPPHPRGGWGFDSTEAMTEQPLETDAARGAEAQIVAAARADLPSQAEAVLQSLAAGNTATTADVARLAHRVAQSYLAEGQDSDAWRVATTALGGDRSAAPMLDWDAGLAAYRIGNYGDSASHFETLAQSYAATAWGRSAGAFWAARAHIAAGDPLRVVTLLGAAAREQPTFYGMLAQRLLGEKFDTQFNDPVLDRTGFAAIVQNSAAHRAVALWQVGETDFVQPEMLRALAALGPDQTVAFAALARSMDLPDLELRASETQASRGVMLTGLFPMPHYTPPGGYQVDPCLVLAFARVESAFQSRAVSGAGARGVMQIMPGTAQIVDGSRPAQLNDPAYSLGVGQKILQQLLSDVNGNLFQLAAAYNAGPASLTHWIGARPAIMNDPLLFIESIPVGQTRSYIRRVMMFYWLYAQRAGRDSPSLDETATGGWPIYREPADSLPAKPQAKIPSATPGTTLISDASIPH